MERHAQRPLPPEDRIGVLDELLNEPTRPQQVPIARPSSTFSPPAQNTASWCNSQPWQVLITSRVKPRKKFRDVRSIPSRPRVRRMTGDFPPPREYRRGLSGPPPRKRLPALQYAGHRARRQDGLCRAGAAELTISSARRMWRSSRRTKPLGVYGAVDCGGYVNNFMLAAQALGLAHRAAGGAGVSLGRGAPAFRHEPTTAASFAASRSAIRTASTRSTATEPTARSWATSRRLWSDPQLLISARSGAPWERLDRTQAVETREELPRARASRAPLPPSLRARHPLARQGEEKCHGLNV